MTLDERLRKKDYDGIWETYCSFLDLTLEEYMNIQKSLMMEQLQLYARCELGKRLLGDRAPASVQAFRETVKLTSYDDYADILLQKKEEALPEKPAIWIQTTWEGGKNPVKVAPYTAGMINGHRGNFLATLILATSTARGEFSLRGKERFLYGMAPLPYLTGIIPPVLEGELSVRFLPSQKEAERMSFSQRNKEGFKLGMRKGIDLFFGLSSVIVRMSESFAAGGTGGGGFNPAQNSLRMNARMIKAWRRAKANGSSILPKDVWKLKGLICSGTDTSHYKKKIEAYWGIRPTEIFGGTEPTCIGTEIWSKNGMVLFPDVCFYEFIPYREMEKSLCDPGYQPKTYLMDELIEGETYELVISNFKGGAFLRYRVGDLFQCVSLKNEKDGIHVPQFAYVDRIPTVIDIAGFTRITEGTITEAMALSRLEIGDWFAVKRYDQEQRPYMQLCLETAGQTPVAMTREIIKEHLTIYFKYVDNDYKDLKKMLGIDPLEIKILPRGTIGRYERSEGITLRKINPSPYDVTELLKLAASGGEG